MFTSSLLPLPKGLCLERLSSLQAPNLTFIQQRARRSNRLGQGRGSFRSPPLQIVDARDAPVGTSLCGRLYLNASNHHRSCCCSCCSCCGSCCGGGSSQTACGGSTSSCSTAGRRDRSKSAHSKERARSRSRPGHSSSQRGHSTPEREHSTSQRERSTPGPEHSKTSRSTTAHSSCCGNKTSYGNSRTDRR